MKDFTTFIKRVIRTGLIASASTTVAAAACGEIKEGNPLVPLNAVSHILWGDEAAEQGHASLKYTATGIALNTLAVTSWAGIHELIADESLSKRGIGSALIDGALVSAAAFVTDYYVVPKRLTPGFEKRLSNKSLLAIYATLAVSLAIGSLRHQEK